jgi:hypothetical protein
MSERKPPMARDLSGVAAGYKWKGGEGDKPAAPAGALTPPSGKGLAAPGDELDQLRAEVRHLTTALEDVVALAFSGADYKERAIMMHRRAVAALTGVVLKTPGSGEEHDA